DGLNCSLWNRAAVGELHGRIVQFLSLEHGDALRGVILGNREVILGEAFNRLAVSILHDNCFHNELGIDADRKSLLAARSGRRLWRLKLLRAGGERGQEDQDDESSQAISKHKVRTSISSKFGRCACHSSARRAFRTGRCPRWLHNWDMSRD